MNEPVKYLYNQYKDITYPDGTIERWKFDGYPMADYIFKFCKPDYRIKDITKEDYEMFKVTDNSLDMKLETGEAEMYVFKFGSEERAKQFEAIKKQLLG